MRRYHLPVPDTQSLSLKQSVTEKVRYLNCRNGDWSVLGYLDQEGLYLKSKSILAGFMLAGLIYGALHLVVWKAPFPSNIEKILWRSSGIILYEQHGIRAPTTSSEPTDELATREVRAYR